MKSLVDGWLDVRRPARVGRSEFAELRDYVNARIPGVQRVSPRYLLELLLATELDIDRSIGGVPLEFRGRVHTRDFATAGRSLVEMSIEYCSARDTGAEQRAADCRRAVLLAKDRLNWQLARPNLSEEKREEKQELLEWFRTWLESPDVFTDWLALRRKQLNERP